jgi:signal transduction histidine kinase
VTRTAPHGDSQTAVRDLAVRLSPAQLTELSHNLRGPLTTIMGYAEVLGDELAQAAAEQVTMVDSIRRNAVRLARLLDNLGTLADMQLSPVPRVREPVDVAALLHQLPGELTIELGEAGVLLAVLPSGRPAVLGDPRRLRQAVRELVRNAIVASEVGQTVMISAGLAAADEAVTIRVEDCGRGIPATELAGVREPFTRTRQSRERQQPGVGLGLTVADGLIRAHGGRLELTSLLGQGTRALITLPALTDAW